MLNIVYSTPKLPVLLDSELPSPFSSSGFVSCTVGLVDVSDFGNKRVVGVGICEHRADGQKDWPWLAMTYIL